MRGFLVAYVIKMLPYAALHVFALAKAYNSAMMCRPVRTRGGLSARVKHAVVVATRQ